jgi:hypothetical protein
VNRQEGKLKADYRMLSLNPFNSMAPGSVRKTVVTLSSDPV